MIVMPRRLETERLLLRPPEDADADAIFAYASDPAVARYMIWPAAEDITDTELFLDDVARGWEAGDDYCWAVVARNSGEVVGAASCQFDEHGAQIGYAFARAVWGQGLASEAGCAIFDAASGLDEIYRIWGSCDVDNLASARVLEKIGLTFEARLVRWAPSPNIDPSGAPRDAFVYAWTR